jgi:DNA gyrase/topoisomerase IV subunit A
MGRAHDGDLDLADTGLPDLHEGSDFDGLPDVRDGLTRLERVILHVLNEAKAEFGERHVPTALLYGRVVEYIDVGAQEFQRALSRLAGR